MFVGVEQAVEIEARRSLVLCLQDSLCIVQPDPLDVLGELTVGAYQLFRSDAQPPVGCVDLFDERVVGYRRFLPSSLVPLPSFRIPHGSRFVPQPGNTTVVTTNGKTDETHDRSKERSDSPFAVTLLP
jgi:hypothetical protein